ncbi:hypothetical protein [Neobacillus cucumis]|nr:hypothetical protein [Neobacillus cucumis]MBM7652584.1 hypothetical protein [Neobacillus cucumis]
MKKLLGLVVLAFILLGSIPKPPADAGQEPQMQLNPHPIEIGWF